MPIILMRLMTSPMFGLQKQGPEGVATRRDLLLCKNIPSYKSNDKELVRVPLCHARAARPEISSCRDLIPAAWQMDPFL